MAAERSPHSDGSGADVPDLWASPKPKKRQRSEDEPRPSWWKRPWAIALAAVVLALGILVALAPTIIASFDPIRIVFDRDGRPAGELLIDDVRLSWFGPQHVGLLELSDAGHLQIVRAEATSSAGLLSLGLGALGLTDLDIGTTRLTGEARIVRGPDGRTNLEEVVEAASGPQPQSQPPTPAEPVRLPEGLKGRLVLDGLTVTFVDQSDPDAGPRVAQVRDLTGDAAFQVGGPMTGSLRAALLHGTDEANLAGPAGTIALDATADSLTDASGLLTLDAARLDVTLEATELPIEALDAVAGAESRLRMALGDRLQARLRVLGTARDATATVTATSERLNADLAFAYIDGVLRTTQPGSVRLQTAGLAPILEATEDAQESAVRFTALPEVVLTLEDLRLHAPADGSEPDLRGSSARLVLRTGAVEGTVAVPAGGDETTAPAQPRPFTIAPAELVLEAPDLAQGVSLHGGTTATLAGQSAGRIAIDLSATGVLDERGRPRAGMPARLEGAVTVNEVATAIAEPFVPTGVIDLTADVGPVLNMELRAETLAADAAGAAPPTRLTLAANAANLTASGGVTLTDGVVAAPERAFELRIASVGPLLSRLLGDAGVSVASGGPVTLTVNDLRVDTAKLGGAAPDLRAVAAEALVTTGTFSGAAILREGEPARPWQLAPVTLAVDAKDLTSGATIRATTSATLAGQPAGSLNVDLRASGLADEAGALVAGVPPRIEGKVLLDGVSTAIAQAWVQDQGLDLPRDLGPTLNLELTAATADAPAASAAGALPPTRLNIAARAEHLTMAGAAVLDERQIATVEPGIELNLTRAGPLVAAMMGPGVRAQGAGFVTATVRNLRVPLEANAPRIDLAAAQIGLRTGDFSLDVPPAEGATGPAERIGVLNVLVTTYLIPSQPTRVALNAALSHRNEPVRAIGDLTLGGLFPSPGAAASVLPVRPVGRIDFTGLPTALARLMPSAPAEPGAPALDLGRLVQEAVGPSLNMTFVSEEASAGGPLAMRLDLQGERVTAQAAARLTPQALELQRAEARSRLTPELAAVLISTYAPEMQPRPRLAGPSNLTLAVTPLTVPLGEGLTPDLARAPAATITVALDGEAILEGLTAEGAEPGTRRNLGPLGIAALNVKAVVPPAALAAAEPGASAGPREATFEATARLLNGPGSTLGLLNIDGRAALASGAPAGPAQATVRVTDVHTTGLDRLAGEAGLVSGALGERVSVQTVMRAEFAPAAAAEGEPATSSLASAALSVNIGAPRLKSVQPVHLNMTERRLTLASPAELRWTVDPAWASRFLAPAPDPAAGGAASPSQIRFTAPMDVAVRLPALVLARGEHVGPLLPGVFELRTELVVPRVQMEVAPGTPAILDNVRATVTGGAQPGQIGFTLLADDAGAAPAAGPEVIGRRPGGTVAVEGVINRIADPSGVITPDRADLTLAADATAIPTSFIDALAQQGGLLVEALGPTVTVQVRATNLSTQAGELSATATSPRAEASLRGRIEDGVFVAQEPVVAQVNEIAPELSSTLVQGLPVIGSLSKPRDAQPAQLRIAGLTAPLDGNLSRLNGDIYFDPGSARFETSRAFASLLKGAGARGAGTIGERLQPLEVRVRDGIATYERIRLPLGEFTVETRGSVDLVNRTLDVITYLPVGSLTDEAAGVFKSGVGQLLGGAGALEQATMVPFRTRGTFESAETRPDLELFAREFTRQISPDRILQEGLRDLLEGQGNRPREPR